MKGLASIISGLGIVVLATAILIFRSILDCFAWIYELLCKLKSTKERELKMTLYLDQIIEGPNKNQTNIVNSPCPHSFGSIAVSDWPLYDSRGHGEKVVAHARGMHLQSTQGRNTSGWSVYMSLVFQDERYKGSTLEVMGITNGNWAIVGGTGEFTRAQGIIRWEILEHRNNNNNFMKVDIHALYSPLPQSTGA